MVVEAVDYGFMPKDIRDNLDMTGKSPVSKQIEWLITSGKLGADAFIFSIRAACEETQSFVRTAPCEGTRDLHKNNLETYLHILQNPDLQKLVCKSKILESARRQKEALENGDRMKARFYKASISRWQVVSEYLPDSRKKTGFLRRVK